LNDGKSTEQLSIGICVFRSASDPLLILISPRLRTNERSPFTNLVLPSNDLRPNAQLKEQITTYLNGSDIVAKYAQPSNRTKASSRTIRITLRSPLEKRSMDVPHDLKAVELWEIAFRLTKGRYASYELRHGNARVPATQEPITEMINAAYEVFIMPLEPTTSNKSSDIEELCLIKVYRDSDYQNSVVSYWVPKQTTKSLESTVFRYYRERFMQKSTWHVEEPFVFWTGLRDTGDNHVVGNMVEDHWGPIARYFNRTNSTGKLTKESVVDKLNNDDGSDDIDHDDTILDNSTLVFKLALGRPPSSSKSKNRDTLSRLDVLKQMFDAYINRLLCIQLPNTSWFGHFQHQILRLTEDYPRR
jgi:hypothetical protein